MAHKITSSTRPVPPSDDLEIRVVRHNHYFPDHDHSYDPARDATLCEVLVRHKADFSVMEEHQNYSSFAIRDQICAGTKARGIPGVETGVGLVLRGKLDDHDVGLVNFSREQQRRTPVTTYAGPAITGATVARAKGAMIYNHPEYPDMNAYDSLDKALGYMLTLKAARAFHGVEIFNDTLMPGGNDPRPVLKWVERNFFDRGLNPGLVSGSDEHGKVELATRVTYTIALARERSPEHFAAAIRKAKTYVAASETAHLEKFMIEEKTRRYRLGDRPELQRQRHYGLTLEIDKLKPQSVVQIIHNGRVEQSTVLGAGLPTVDYAGHFDFRAEPVAKRHHGYVYVQVLDEAGKLYFVTSAIMYNLRPPAPH